MEVEESAEEVALRAAITKLKLAQAAELAKLEEGWGATMKDASPAQLEEMQLQALGQKEALEARQVQELRALETHGDSPMGGQHGN